MTGNRTPKCKFKTYPIGYFRIYIAGVQMTEGKLRLFVAIDRISKFAFIELHRDNGIQFTNHAHHKRADHHIFDRVCDENGIEHRVTKAKHSWPTGRSSG